MSASVIVLSAAKDHERADYMAVPDEEPEDMPPTTPSETPSREEFWDLTPLKESIAHLTKRFRKPVLIFCLTAFFLKRVAFTSEAFVYQYASEKFGWELRKTAWLGFAAAVGAVIATLIANPSLNFVFATHGYNVHKLDHAVVVVSLFILASALFSIWAASSGSQVVIGMAAAGLGEGLEPALQGLVAFATSSAERPQMFATLAICDTLSELVGGPMTAALMGIGRGDGHPSAGVNFLAACVLFTILMIWGLLVALFFDDSGEPAP